MRCLKLWYDEPSPISERNMKQIFRSSSSLDSLELLNVTEIAENVVENILTYCRPGLKLKVRLDGNVSSDVRGIKMLEDHRELFGKIVVEIARTGTVIGWIPIFRSDDSTCYLQPATKSLILECPGLHRLITHDLCRIKTLKLHKSCRLIETDLLPISRLSLHTFEINEFKAGEFVWLQSFDRGFFSLKSLSITDCANITDKVLESLSRKHLSSITIDINNGATESDGIPHLYKLAHLRELHVVVNQIVTDVLLNGVLAFWLNLDILLVDESLFGYDQTVRTTKRLSVALKMKTQVKLVHRINGSRTKEIFTLEKSDW